MSQYLPTGGFRWVDDCQQLAKTIAEQPADSPEGYILEVDLEYPEDLHDAHNAYPLAPERMMVQKEWMSEYQHNLLGLGVAPTEVEKLVPNLCNKDRYVLHYRNLQLYMSLGMRLTKVHRALRFDQSPWMEPYVRMNNELKKKKKKKKKRLVLNRKLADLLGFSREMFEPGQSHIADKPHRLFTHREICVHLAEVSTSENLHNGRPSTLLKSIPVENERCGVAGQRHSLSCSTNG